jgi:hypothetical protein
MSFFKIQKCFFTGQTAINSDEPIGCLDGYHYEISYNGKRRRILLYLKDDWANDAWIKQNGQSFLELLDKADNWGCFEKVPTINEIRQIHLAMQGSLRPSPVIE